MPMLALTDRVIFVVIFMQIDHAHIQFIFSIKVNHYQFIYSTEKEENN